MQKTLVTSALWWFFVSVSFKIEPRKQRRQHRLSDSELILLHEWRKRNVHMTLRRQLGCSIYASYVQEDIVKNQMLISNFTAFKYFSRAKVLDEAAFGLDI